MKRLIRTACVVLALVHVPHAAGHGTSIQIQPVAPGTSLSATGEVPDENGFAPEIFVEDDEDGDPLPTPTFLPALGAIRLWQIPGLSISGMNNASSLSIEVMARPVKDSSPLEQRVLWYWNPTNGEVEESATDLFLLGTAGRFTALFGDNPIPPAPFLLANSVSGQQFADNHGLMSYALDNDPTPTTSAPVGAYGFFARFTSSHHGESNPFLLVLNNDIDHGLMMTAALAINAAAVDSPSGDFNQDGSVDAADYVMWRKTNGTGAEYELWHETFGTSGGAGTGPLALGMAAEVATVPEPFTSAILVSLSFAIVGITRRLRGCNS